MVLGVPARSRFASLTLGHLRRESIAAAFLVFSMAVTDYGIPLAVGGKVENAGYGSICQRCRAAAIRQGLYHRRLPANSGPAGLSL